MELPNEDFFFLLAIVAMITEVAKEIYPLIKIMQLIGPNHNWENEVKKIKNTEENSLQSSI